jgi:hypothetical protein
MKGKERGASPRIEKGTAMLRLWTVVLAMEVVAVAAAVWVFGYLVLLIGAPLIVATVCVLVVARVSDTARARRQARAESERTVVFHPVPQAGLMSGFFTPTKEQPRPTDSSGSVRH